MINSGAASGCSALMLQGNVKLDMSGKHRSSHATLNAPTLVLVAGTAIIAVRCLDLLMLFGVLGPRGILDFLYRSAQTWNLTAVFLGSLLLLFIELRCAFAIMRGRNWGRWGYLFTRLVALGYLWAASLGWGYPELFSIVGGSPGEILNALLIQKLPDLLVLFLIFVPAKSRRYFRLG